MKRPLVLAGVALLVGSAPARAEPFAACAQAADRGQAARDKEALLLQAEGFSYDEIASALGLARGAIGTTLARARKRLVESYRAREAEEARRNAAS